MGILTKMAQTKNKPLVNSGFKILKSIVYDFLNKLSSGNIENLIEIIYTFSTQQEQEINISLTASNMFWNIAETIALGEQRPLKSARSVDEELVSS